MDIVKRLGVFGLPLMYLIGGFTLYQHFSNMVPEVGVKAISLAAFFAFFIWAVWYLASYCRGRVIDESQSKQYTLKHKSKFGRMYAYVVPTFIGVLALLPWLQQSEPDYSDYFKQGAGIAEWIVVFDSVPRGAEVRVVNQLYYQNEDAFLEKESDRVLSGQTVMGARLSQGWYWAVFELNGEYETEAFVLSGNRVVKADFTENSLLHLRPYSLGYVGLAVAVILLSTVFVSGVLRKKQLIIVNDSKSS